MTHNRCVYVFAQVSIFLSLNPAGIRHDDYDYGEVNKLLDRSLKTFIKTACCYPDRITKQDYDSILVELLDSEKVHVNLMILEAKNQAVLLYALRELNR
jgi:sestrin 1/3